MTKIKILLVRKCMPYIILLITVFYSLFLSSVSASGQSLSTSELPLISAVFNEKAPAIDGRLSRGEWGNASSFCGYRHWPYGELPESDITTFLQYSKNCLFLLFVIPLNPSQRLICNSETRDGEVWKDDSIEVFLQPEDNGPFFQTIVNSKGVIFDRRGKEIAWNGKWQIANYVGLPPENLAEIYPLKRENVWIIEMSISFSEFGRKFPSPGELWRINFCLNTQRKLVFAPTFKEFADTANFGYLKFSDSEAALALITLGSPSSGLLNFQGRLINNSTHPVDILIKGEAESPTVQIEGLAKDLAKGKKEMKRTVVPIEKTFNLKPLQATEFTIPAKLMDKRLNLLRVDVVQNPGNPDEKILYHNALSLNLVDPFNIIVENFPSNRKLRLLLDTQAVTDRKGLECSISIYGAGRKEFFTEEITVNDIKMLKTIEYKNWPEGDYTLEGILFNKGGIITSTIREFSILHKPEWLDRTLGISDRVLKPWIPIEYGSNNTVKVWGRKVRWGNSLFPESIISAGREILAAPITGLIVVEGREYEMKPNRIRFTSRNKNRSEMKISGRIGSKISFQSDIWMEYDGLIWFTLKISSPLKQQISSLKVVVPLREESARYFGYDRNAGAIKEGVEKFGFSPVFLIGSEERGICFACESTKDWEMKWGKSALTLNKETGKVVFSVNLISKECNISGDKEYSFGFQPMPVKPLPPDWHSWKATVYRETRNSWWKKYAKNLDAVVIWAYEGGNRRRPYMLTVSGPSIASPMTANDNLGKIVQEVHQYGDTPALPYNLMGFIDNDEVADPLLNKQHKAYMSEWLARPFSQGPFGVRGCSVVCLSSSYQDYLVYALKRMIDKYGIDGVYFDGCGPNTCQNYDHGCGWQSEDGGWYPTYNILSTRNFLKRVATLLEEATEKNPVIPESAGVRQPWPNYYIWGHSSRTAVPPVQSFITIRFDGEQFQGTSQGLYHYKDLLNLDYFRAEFLSTQTGILSLFLPFSKPSEINDTSAILAYLLPHGVGFYPEYIDRELAEKVWDAQIDFDTRSARFTPCWQDNLPIKHDSVKENILVACWEKEDKLLAVVSNIGSKQEKIKLEINWGKNGKNISVYDALNRENIITEFGKMPLDIPANSFRMFVISGRSEKSVP